MQKDQRSIHQSDVVRANALRKLRILHRMNEQNFAQNMNVSTEALRLYESAQTPVPDFVIMRACALAGLQPADFESGGRIDDLFNKAKIPVSEFMPQGVPSGELFDLLNAYALVCEKQEFDKGNILSLLRMLVCGKPDSLPEGHKYGGS